MIHSGLELATEARKAEKTLTRWRDHNNLQDSQNVDLTFAVEFNLAHMYHENKNYKEALELYQSECACMMFYVGQSCKEHILLGIAVHMHGYISTTVHAYVCIHFVM